MGNSIGKRSSKAINRVEKILVIQTAFIGDAILATAVLEALHAKFPEIQIDYLVRKGAEGLFKGHPFLGQVMVFDKKASRFSESIRLIKAIRQGQYSHVINCHRFGSSGLFTWLSGAKYKAGFAKHPYSFAFDHRADHVIEASGSPHEVERNHALLNGLVEGVAPKPKLYPGAVDVPAQAFITIAPASVWFTKQLPEARWVDLIKSVPPEVKVLLLGGPGDKALCQRILDAANREHIENKAGQYSLLESAGVMQKAVMNYTNDSAPCHLASAVNAPVRAAFVSTVPEFGFTPLSDNSKVAQVAEQLDCRPCGLHGHKACPEGHFNCSKIELKYEG